MNVTIGMDGTRPVTLDVADEVAQVLRDLLERSTQTRGKADMPRTKATHASSPEDRTSVLPGRGTPQELVLERDARLSKARPAPEPHPVNETGLEASVAAMKTRLRGKGQHMFGQDLEKGERHRISFYPFLKPDQMASTVEAPVAPDEDGVAATARAFNTLRVMRPPVSERREEGAALLGSSMYAHQLDPVKDASSTAFKRYTGDEPATRKQVSFAIDLLVKLGLSWEAIDATWERILGEAWVEFEGERVYPWLQRLTWSEMDRQILQPLHRMYRARPRIHTYSE